jgi:hypothetical protein
MKHPPVQMDDRESRRLIDEFLGVKVRTRGALV